MGRCCRIWVGQGGNGEMIFAIRVDNEESHVELEWDAFAYGFDRHQVTNPYHKLQYTKS
jgi:hypothetical protein